ncbi:hypothetical protein Esti_006181 [Eimeria stiedai]
MGDPVTISSGSGLGGLLARWWRANQKAKMLLEFLGFESAAALPAHLQSAVLQVLLLGPVGPFRTRPADQVNGAMGNRRAHATQLRSEGCAVQCLFSSWLTKTSKWLKTPRLRYVLLLSVTPDRCCMQKLRRSSSSDGHSTKDSTDGSFEPQPPQQQPAKKRAVSHLLLVAFKVPLLSRSSQAMQVSNLQGLQRAEPSEAFTIDNTHRAVCRRIPQGEGSKLVLIVEGLGGRLLVLGEEPPFPTAASSSSVAAVDQPAGVSPLEELAKLINDAAPFCAAPRPSRWEGVFNLFSAAAAADGFGTSALLPDSTQGETQWRRGELPPYPKRRRSRELPSMTDEDALAVCSARGRGAAVSETYEEVMQKKSLIAFLVRCSTAACHAICRPLTLAVRQLSTSDSTPSTDAEDTRGLELDQEAEEAACSACTSSPRRGDDGSPCTRSRRGCPHACSWIVQRKRLVNGSSLTSGSNGTSFQQYTLRQLIDDQQRAVAAYAMRERCRNVALLRQEQQARTQQASKALMNDHGQLHPQARRWLDATDGHLLMQCLTGHKRRPSASPRS